MVYFLYFFFVIYVCMYVCIMFYVYSSSLQVHFNIQKECETNNPEMWDPKELICKSWQAISIWSINVTIIYLFFP